MSEQERNNDQAAIIERVFRLTQKMEQAASTGDWTQAEELERERSPLLLSIRAEQEPASLELIGQIRAMNQGILERELLMRSTLSEQYQTAMAHISDVREYLSVAALASVSREPVQAAAPKVAGPGVKNFVADEDRFDWL